MVPNLKQTNKSINRKMDQEVSHTVDYYLLRAKELLLIHVATQVNIKKRYMKQEKPDAKEYILCDSLSVKSR